MHAAISSRLPIRAVADEGKQLSCHKYFSVFYKFECYFATIIAIIMSVFTVALGFLIVAQVLLRYVFTSPWLGIEELSPLFALWAYFLGAAFCVRIRDHIGGGMLTLFFKNTYLIKVIRLIGSLVCFITITLFAYYAYTNMMANLNIGRLSIYMRWPKWWWDASMTA